MVVGGEFDGVGLLAYGLHLAGLRHAWLCEVDPWRRSILELRFPGVQVFDDVRSINSASATRPDVIAGGFPCKGVSSAGGGAGFGHPETVLWREMLRTVRELRPRYVLVENVANLLRLRPPGGEPGDLFREVLGGLCSLGFDVVWDCLPAAAVGAPHRRDRVFAVAWHPDRAPADPLAATGGSRGAVGQRSCEALADPDGPDQRRHGGQLGEQGGRPDVGGERQAAADADQRELGSGRDGGGADGFQEDSRGAAVEWGEFGPAVERWERLQGPAPEPLIRRVDDGGTRRVERSRLSALGDGVCVQVGYLAGRYIVDLERERVAA